MLTCQRAAALWRPSVTRHGAPDPNALPRRHLSPLLANHAGIVAAVRVTRFVPHMAAYYARWEATVSCELTTLGDKRLQMLPLVFWKQHVNYASFWICTLIFFTLAKDDFLCFDIFKQRLIEPQYQILGVKKAEKCSFRVTLGHGFHLFHILSFIFHFTHSPLQILPLQCSSFSLQCLPAPFFTLLPLGMQIISHPPVWEMHF